LTVLGIPEELVIINSTRDLFTCRPNEIIYIRENNDECYVYLISELCDSIAQNNGALLDRHGNDFSDESKKILLANAAIHERIFVAACDALDEAINDAKMAQGKRAMALAAEEALVLARHYKMHHGVNHELAKLTKWLNGMAKLLDDPNGYDFGAYKSYLEIHADNTREAMHLGAQYQWAKIIGGIMLAIVGIAMITLAVMSLVSTFAVSSPVSVPALAMGSAFITLGASILGSKVAAGVVLGAGALVGAGFFAHQGFKGDIKSCSENFASAATTYRNKYI
jgi:hypothetical protein